MKNLRNGRNESTPAKEIAYIALMTAILTGGQFVLANVAGVEIVTVLLLCFAWKTGPRGGVLIGIAFSLLRCFIWGFYPSVIVLYLIYYPLFAVLFGCLGRIKKEGWSNFPVWGLILADVILAAVMTGAGYCAISDFLKISALAEVMVKNLLWVIFALSAVLFVILNVLFILKKSGRLKRDELMKSVVITAAAAMCTICFSLIDDVITPLFYGWGFDSVAAATYFYTSFLAMVPQTVCTIVTVSLFFLPLTTLLDRVVR